MAYGRWLWLAVVAICVVGCGVRHVSAASARDIPGTFRSGGMDRTYMLHVPAGDPVGLVLSLHGGGGSGISQRALTGFDTVAEAHNLLVVYPDGYDKSWADGRGASPADRHHINDVAFLVGLVTKVQHDYGVAPGHVFVTGMSNGGFMSNRLACERADVFAAVAPVAGTLGVGVACNPSQPVSVWEAHGTADPLVPFKGGAVRGRGGLSHSISADTMVDKWRSADGCQGDPAMEALPDVRDGTVVHRYESTGCAANTEVVFYKIDRGGHTWPGGKQYLPAAVIGPTTRALDGSEAIAQFFLAHARD
ncbi:PHB depolymerase family esterase [Mycobacterium sp. 1245852.3]|uniref:extracellular catalytic domain type 1 short-chain-length polyhydroxyalkanoate depolymerase n=1 Tax=Mycobacterium sp. 1245852.3 TaxID=1856860 RepID=UPI0008007CBC|nr:PHB depolymerase family esterase [Mycobacterium sp. 1245852.3]OBK13757.1 esterase [Mycobacterium sp. 1245852.3]